MATQLFAARLGEFNIPVFEVSTGGDPHRYDSHMEEKYDKLIEVRIVCTTKMGRTGRCWKSSWPHLQKVISCIPRGR